MLATTRIRVLGLPQPAVLVTADDVARGKPDPEPYLKGAQGLGMKAADCVVIEDAPAGIRAAHGAGMRVISMPSTYPVEELREADYLVTGLSQIRVAPAGDDGRTWLQLELGDAALEK